MPIDMLSSFSIMCDFPPEAIEEAKRIASLQKLLGYVDDANIEQTADELMNTVFVTSIERIYQLVHELCSMIEIRFQRLPALAKLIAVLNKRANDSNALSHLVPIILKSGFRPYGKLYLHKKAITLTFVRHCLLQGAISIDVIAKQIHRTLNNCIFDTPDNSLFYIYFGYELKSYNLALYNNLFSKTTKEDLPISDVIENFEIYTANNWEKMHQLTEYGCLSSEPLMAVLHDDVEALSKFTDFGVKYNNLFFQPRFLYERESNLIQIAAFYRSFECFKFLLEKGLQLKGVEIYAAAGGDRQIVEICKSNGLEFQETLKTIARFQRLRLFEEIFNSIDFIKQDHDFESLNSNFAGSLDSVFSKCARVNNVNSLLFTMTKGVTPTRWNVGDKIFHLASEGHLGPLMLLASLPDVDVGGVFHNSTALFQACEYGHLGCVKFLLTKRGADLGVRKGSRTVLHCAALNGMHDVVEFLVANPAVDVNAVDASKKTPLFCAISAGYVRCIQALLNCPRVDRNARDSDGATPLHFAARNAAAGVVEAVAMSEGIELNARDRLGNTPFHYAAQREVPGPALALSAVAGVDVSAQNAVGNTPLHLAAEAFTSSIDVVIGLKGVDVNARNVRGSTPLHAAARRNRARSVASLLMAPGVEVNATDGQGQTALLIAASSGFVDVVRALIARDDVDVNAGNPLYAAAAGEWTDVVAALAGCGRVDLNAPGPDGKTAADVATHEARAIIKGALLGQ